MADVRTGSKNYKISLEHLVVPESNKVLKKGTEEKEDRKFHNNNSMPEEHRS